MQTFDGRGHDVHGFRVADFEKVHALRLDLDQLALRVAPTNDANRVALVQAKLVHDLWTGRQMRSSLSAQEQNGYAPIEAG